MAKNVSDLNKGGRLVTNKKASFNYEVLETFEAGIELLGNEVKSLRNSEGSLEAAHVTVRGAEAYLIGCHIPPYQPLNTQKDYAPDRNRKLLLTKKEIKRIADEESKKGLTVVPLSIYCKGPKIKTEIAIVRGKKQFDKRETIKKRDSEREMRRTLKNE